MPLAGGQLVAFRTARGAPITAPVAVADGRIFVPCEDGYLYVFGPGGKAALPDKDLEIGRIRSPLTGKFTDAKYDWYTNYGNFAGTNANEQGLAPPLRMRWTRRLEGTVKHVPVCGGGRLYTHTAEGQVIAVEQDTGRLLWRRYWPDVFLSFTSPLYIDGKLLVPGLKNAVESASLLIDRSRLDTSSNADGIVVDVPASAPDAICSVVVLKVKGELDIEPQIPVQADDGKIALTTDEVILHGKKIKVEQSHHHGNLKAAESNVGYWIDPEEWIEWQFKVTQPGKFEISADLASVGAGNFQIVVGDNTLEAAAPNTGNYQKYKTVTLGTIEIGAGKISLAVKPVKEAWEPINVSAFKLSPTK